MSPSLRTLVLCAALASQAGCINVSRPGTAFASEPPGARVRVDGRDSGWVTPCQIALDEEQTHVVELALEGFGAREILLVPDERVTLLDWSQGVNGVRSTIRFPLLLPVGDLFFPFREVHSLVPGQVFLRLHPVAASAP